MESGLVNKVELVEHVARKAGLSKADASAAVEAVTEGIANSLKRGEEVRLVHFGIFSVRRRGEGVGRHPVTGEKLAIPPAKNAHFKPAAALKSLINTPRE